MSNRIEQYLEEISRPLAEPQRSEWREEVRQHIESLVAAHQELGLSRDDAVEAAIASFGAAQNIGADVKRETANLGHSSATLALWGMTQFVIAVIPGFITLGALAALYALYGGEEFLANIGRIAASLAVISPLFAGWVIGRKASPNHLRRDLLLVPIMGCFASLPMAMIFSVLHQPGWKPNPMEIALWLPYALFAAWLSYFVSHKPDETPLKS